MTIGVLVADPYRSTAAKSLARWSNAFGFERANACPFHDMLLECMRVNNYHGAGLEHVTDSIGCFHREIFQHSRISGG